MDVESPGWSEERALPWGNRPPADTAPTGRTSSARHTTVSVRPPHLDASGRHRYGSSSPMCLSSSGGKGTAHRRRTRRVHRRRIAQRFELRLHRRDIRRHRLLEQRPLLGIELLRMCRELQPLQPRDLRRQLRDLCGLVVDLGSLARDRSLCAAISASRSASCASRSLNCTLRSLSCALRSFNCALRSIKCTCCSINIARKIAMSSM